MLTVTAELNAGTGYIALGNPVGARQATTLRRQFVHPEGGNPEILAIWLVGIPQGFHCIESIVALNRAVAFAMTRGPTQSGDLFASAH